MADSLPAVAVPHDDWVDVLDSAGISAGTTVLIQNLSRALIYVSNTATKPSGLDPQDGITIGAAIKSLDTWQATTPPALWVRTTDPKDSAFIALQEA